MYGAKWHRIGNSQMTAVTCVCSNLRDQPCAIHYVYEGDVTFCLCRKYRADARDGSRILKRGFRDL